LRLACCFVSPGVASRLLLRLARRWPRPNMRLAWLRVSPDCASCPTVCRTRLLLACCAPDALMDFPGSIVHLFIVNLFIESLLFQLSFIYSFSSSYLFASLKKQKACPSLATSARRQSPKNGPKRWSSLNKPLNKLLIFIVSFLIDAWKDLKKMQRMRPTGTFSDHPLRS
jgi:hypothetical protein